MSKGKMTPWETSHPHLLWIARFDYRGGVRVVEHEHPFHQCLLVLGGEADVRVDGESHTVRPHDLLWLSPGVRHGWDVAADTYLETLDMKFSLPDPGILGDSPPQSGIHTARTDLEIPFRAVYACARSAPQTRELRCALMLYAFLLHTQLAPDAEFRDWEGTGMHTDAPGVVQTLEHLFSESPGHKWTASEIAARLHLSYRRISQLCQEQKNRTPLQILREVRIRKARELLCYGDVAVKEVADLTGFENVHHFSRCFREEVGLPPAAWRIQERDKPRSTVHVARGFHNENRVVEG